MNAMSTVMRFATKENIMFIAWWIRHGLDKAADAVSPYVPGRRTACLLAR